MSNQNINNEKDNKINRRNLDFSRGQLALPVRQQLERKSFPRLQMLLLVGLTGVLGFLASFLLFHIGVQTIWLTRREALNVAFQFKLPFESDAG